MFWSKFEITYASIPHKVIKIKITEIKPLEKKLKTAIP